MHLLGPSLRTAFQTPSLSQTGRTQSCKWLSQKRWTQRREPAIPKPGAGRETLPPVSRRLHPDEPRPRSVSRPGLRSSVFEACCGAARPLRSWAAGTFGAWRPWRRWRPSSSWPALAPSSWSSWTSTPLRSASGSNSSSAGCLVPDPPAPKWKQCRCSPAVAFWCQSLQRSCGGLRSTARMQSAGVSVSPRRRRAPATQRAAPWVVLQGSQCW
mmetsp:Transcript_58347/g.183144  ORF Transcript_58347/g.183144 Transcript_58347/m.183144 type:complete len:213 (-) Transcript_58347:546-1184(-)